METKNNRRWPYLIPLAMLALGSIPTFNAGCFWRATLGIPCPTCGLSRATERLLHGDFAGAWQMHPFVFLLVPLAAVILVIIMNKWRKRKKDIVFTWPHYSKAIALGVIGLLYLIFMVRMVLLYPHTEPLVWNDDALLPRTIRFIRLLVESISTGSP